MKRTWNRILSVLLCLSLLLAFVPVGAQAAGSELNIRVTPSATDACVGDVVEFTVTAKGSDVSALEFSLIIPQGMTYVEGSATVPVGLKDNLGWAAAEWIESDMYWVGYNDEPKTMDYVILTFSCVVEKAGAYEVELYDLCAYDADYFLFQPGLTVGAVNASEYSMEIFVLASNMNVKVGDTVHYTVFADGAGVTAMEFFLTIPQGMTYVSGSAAVPEDANETLGWEGAEWIESDMRWEGYNDLPNSFHYMILTFSCVVEKAGTHEIGLYDALAYDSDYEEFEPVVTVDSVTAVGSSMEIFVRASEMNVQVGDTVHYTVFAGGVDVTAMEFILTIPQGMTYVAGSATVPKDAKETLGWAGTEWSEQDMRWEGYNDLPTSFQYMILTFSCVVEEAGTYEVELYDALAYDMNYDEFAPLVTVDSVSAAGCDHSFTNYVYNNDGTCYTDGTQTAWCDNGCGESDTIAAPGTAGHSFTDYVYNNDATCFANGTQTAWCDNGCGESDTIAAPDTALGHSFTQYQPNNNATCITNATETAWCDHGCGVTQNRIVPDTALGHSFTNYDHYEPATCTSDSYYTAWCNNGCGATDYMEGPDKAYGHSFTNYQSDNNATCTTDGTKTAYCDNGCGYIDSVTDPGSAPGHSFSYYSSNNDATCTTDGTKTAMCDNLCGVTDTVVDEFTATGHRFGSYISDQNATCTEDGTKTAYCEHLCGTTDTLVEEYSALGHSFTNYIPNYDATCSADGTKTAHCDNGCGLTDTVTDEYTATTHSFINYVPNGDATCDWSGTETAACEYGCGMTDTRNSMEPAPGHSFTNYIPNYDATCYWTGTETAECDNGCGMTDTRMALDGDYAHSYADGVCTNCGAQDPNYAPVVIPTLTLKAPTLEFKDMITIITFYTAENLDDVVEMGMITYSYKATEGNIQTAEHVIPGATYDAGSGRYFSASQGIHAKYLGDTVYLSIYAKLSDGSYTYTKVVPYSPITYATNQLKNSTNMSLKQLVAAMLNYGAAAQVYFGHNTDNLANAGMTAEQLALPEAYRADMIQSVPAADQVKQGIFYNNKGFSKRSPAVSFEGAFSINYFFTPAYLPVGEITFYYWNEADFAAADVLTPENASGSFAMSDEGQGQYRADIEGIAAKDLSKAVYVAAVYSDGTNTWTSGVLGYSIGAYCANQAAKGGTMADLAKATAVYGYHAKAYFG